MWSKTTLVMVVGKRKGCVSFQNIENHERLNTHTIGQRRALFLIASLDYQKHFAKKGNVKGKIIIKNIVELWHENPQRNHVIKQVKQLA